MDKQYSQEDLRILLNGTYLAYLTAVKYSNPSF